MTAVDRNASDQEPRGCVVSNNWMEQNLRFASISTVMSHLSRGTFSAVALCRFILDTIRACDGAIGAFSQVLAETALGEAAASDARRETGRVLGPLEGIPIAIKDLIDTRPAVCSAGLDHLADYVPATDASVVAALRAAGAMIIGVTETDPGAFSTDTPRVVNPLEPDRTVGGSSGGSAAALAAGLAFAAIGTDTGGSIRIPAACCSIFGLKPTWGRVDATGVRPLARSVDHVGPLARSIDDLILIQSVIDPALGPMIDPGDAWVLGNCPAYFSEAHRAVQEALVTSVDIIRSHGIAIRDISLPAPRDVLPFHMINVAKEAADYHIATFPGDWPDYPETARAAVEIGRATTTADHAWAQARRATATALVDQALETVDAIILPTMLIDAPPRGMVDVTFEGVTMTRLEATVRLTALFNQTGHPVLTLPASRLPDGRAISIQIVGSKNEDAKLLAIGARIARDLNIVVDYAQIVDRRADDARRMRAEIDRTSSSFRATARRVMKQAT